jgi:hypothetical protein
LKPLFEQFCSNSFVRTVLFEQFCSNSFVRTVLLQYFVLIIMK